MKAGWQKKILDDVCDLITCGVAARPHYVDVGVPFLSAKNVKDGKILWSGYNCVSKETHDELTKNNKPLKGDILYTRVGSFGEAAVIDDEREFSVFVSLTLIKPKKSLLNNYFLKYYLNSSEVKELAKRSISSSGVGNLNVGTVREFPILLPPLPEQQRIVAILDEVFEGIATATANAKKNLNNARELFESTLQSVFTDKGDGWVDTTIGQHIRFIDYRGKTPVKTESGLRLITAKNVKMGYIQETPMEFIAPKGYDSWMTRGIPQMGDVLFTTEAPLANVAQLDTDEKVAFAQRIIIMQPDALKLNSTFLKYLLLSQTVQQRIHSKGTGATVKGIKAAEGVYIYRVKVIGNSGVGKKEFKGHVTLLK